MGNYTTNYDLFQQKIMQYHHFLSKKRIDKQANLGQNKTVTIITIFLSTECVRLADEMKRRKYL